MSRDLSLDELVSAAEDLGRRLPEGAVVFLEGELGAGKTTAANAICRGLGVAEGATSPTFALVHRYQGARGPVFHVDCYRLRTPDEARDLDWEGMTTEGDVLIVEWPAQAVGWTPKPTQRIVLEHLDDPDLRRATGL